MPKPGDAPRIARFVSRGFFNHRIRRIAWLAGIDLRPGLPREGEYIAAWGHGDASARAEAVAQHKGAAILRFEDAFLRSLHPRGDKEATLGLTIDASAAHFDSRTPSDLETLLATHPFDDGALIDRARAAMEELARSGVTKYAATRTDLETPAPGYVLVIDQSRGDASIRLGGALEQTFREMLLVAREENPGQPILIKTHPDTAAQGRRPGHYSEADATHGATLETRPIPPATLFAGATKVYTVSSQLGFEAMLHSHRPITFGQPFYSGWGLDDDRNPLDRRQRKLTRAQLFAGALVLYPHWYDPHRDALCDPVDVVRILDARARAWREDRAGWSAPGMRLAKRAPLRRFLSKRVTFRDDPKRRKIVWGDGHSEYPSKPLVHTGRVQGVYAGCMRVENGFLGLRDPGADTSPVSLVLDKQGIYYDPAQRSDLEDAIERAATLPPEALDRARKLRRSIREARLSENNHSGQIPDLPDTHIILIPGQVADDASIRFGTAEVTDNAQLLAETRKVNPDAFIIYQPHPDVEAGLREGAIDAIEADLIASNVDPIALVEKASEVWTMTSPMGFDALLRDTPVTTFGAPFYAGWGLTDDKGKTPARRRSARPSLDALIHAVLIDYPRYFDPITGTACPPETIVHRLTRGPMPPGPANRLLAKAQGALASYPWPWR
ncbi:MAG: capsular polysaccharide biosynthesis protein [Pseudomonadota bacterium]